MTYFWGKKLFIGKKPWGVIKYSKKLTFYLLAHNRHHTPFSYQGPDIRAEGQIWPAEEMEYRAHQCREYRVRSQVDRADTQAELSNCPEIIEN